GVILGIGGFAGLLLRGQPRHSAGYHGRGQLEQDLSCVSGACMVARRDVFHGVGGFDERFPVAWNDVDLCIRIRRAGWRIIWTPQAELYHHESASLGAHDGPERKEEFEASCALMRERWSDVLDADPAYNPNL